MSRHARLLATILALAPAAAHADPALERPKLAILAGPGVRAEWVRDDSDTYSKVRMLPSLAATVAYRLSPRFALGIHASAARYSDEMIYPDETFRWSVISVDGAIALQYERDRFTVTPWLGGHFTRYHDEGTLCALAPVRECTSSHRTEWTSDFVSFGLTASFLPVRSVPIAVFLVLQDGIGKTAYDTRGLGAHFDYSAATLGLAYQR